MTRRAVRRTLLFLVALFLVACLWEAYKAIGPEQGGSFLGIPLAKTNDHAMPHTWDMLSRLNKPENRAGGQAIWRSVLGYAWFSFKLAAFLAFFPISVGTLRGLASAPAAATELMQSYAAGWWRTLFKLRFPSAVPSMVPALKLGATLAVVGVVVSEISIGVKGGIGRAVISYSQAATGDPTKVYAAVFGAAAMGLVLYGLIVLIDLLLTRNRPQEVEG